MCDVVLSFHSLEFSDIYSSRLDAVVVAVVVVIVAVVVATTAAAVVGVVGLLRFCFRCSTLVPENRMRKSIR